MRIPFDTLFQQLKKVLLQYHFYEERAELWARLFAEASREGEQLPVPGGFDEEGNMTTDPAAIEKTFKGLPLGYWKGSGLSLVLEM